MQNLEVFVAFFTMLNLVASVFVIGFLNDKLKNVIKYVEKTAAWQSDNALQIEVQLGRLKALVDALDIERQQASKTYKNIIFEQEASPAEKEHEAFLKRSPDYEQLGALSLLKPEHLAMFKKMDWTLQRCDGDDLTGPTVWCLLRKNGEIVFANKDLGALLIKASALADVL